MKYSRALLLTLFTAFAPLPSHAAVPPQAGFADLVEKLSPAVVNISTSQKVKSAQGRMGPFSGLPPELQNAPELEPFREFFDRFGQQQKGGDGTAEREVYSLGSGFIIDPKGFVITNYHVIDEADEITITLSDNTKYKAQIVGRDKKTDLALLKVEAKKDLPFVPLGDSDVMRVGDWVIAIGNPFGLGGSVTQGIISARQRSINSGPFDDFLQTDAPINRGNSGGPLFNLGGEVIGINTAIFSPSGGSVGIGFAIPASLAKPVIEQLKAYGRTHRGWLGVKIQEVSDEVADSVGLPKTFGALVLEVTKDSPADKAGIKAGDVITMFDGAEIAEMRFLPRRVAETKIGKNVSITYWRANTSKTVEVKLGELEEEEKENASASSEDRPTPKTADVQNVMGVDVVPLSPEARQRFRLSDEQKTGLVVMAVEGGSEAARRGLRPGDVIVDVNNAAVTSVEAFKKAFDVAHKAGRKFALVKVVRGKDSAFITLPTEEKKSTKEPALKEPAPE